MKSDTACNAAKEMNPDMNLTPHQNRVGPETEKVDMLNNLMLNRSSFPLSKSIWWWILRSLCNAMHCCLKYHHEGRRGYDSGTFES